MPICGVVPRLPGRIVTAVYAIPVVPRSVPIRKVAPSATAPPITTRIVGRNTGLPPEVRAECTGDGESEQHDDECRGNPHAWREEHRHERDDPA